MPIPYSPPEDLKFRTSDLVFRGSGRAGSLPKTTQWVMHSSIQGQGILPSFLAPAAATPLTQPGCRGRTFSSFLPIFCPVRWSGSIAVGTNADVSFLSGGRGAVARDSAVRDGGLGGQSPRPAVPFVFLLPVHILAAYLRLWVWSEWLLWGSICRLSYLLFI